MQSEAFVRTATSVVTTINQTPLTRVTQYLGDIHDVRQDANLPPLTPDYRDYERLLNEGVPPARLCWRHYPRLPADTKLRLRRGGAFAPSKGIIESFPKENSR